MTPNPICVDCVHYTGTAGMIGKEGLSCKAFPNGIPLNVFYAKFIHTQPYPNAEQPTDNGIRFEVNPKIPFADLGIPTQMVVRYGRIRNDMTLREFYDSLSKD